MIVLSQDSYIERCINIAEELARDAGIPLETVEIDGCESYTEQSQEDFLDFYELAEEKLEKLGFIKQAN